MKSGDTTDEIKDKFDGSHLKGTPTYLGFGVPPDHELLIMYLEVEDVDKEQVYRIECQMDREQAESLSEMVAQSLKKIEQIFG